MAVNLGAIINNYWNECGSKSLLGYNKTMQLFHELCEVVNLEGNTAEIGVFEGYTSRLIHSATPKRRHYCYDTFSGIQGATSSDDCHKNGEFNCPLTTVKNNINLDNVEYKVGYFPDTFNEFNEKFIFVHSDTDTYIGTFNTIKYFKDIIVPGGKIIFDDYEWSACPGVKKALLEFAENDIEFLHKPMPNMHQYVLTKL
jgi:hypothetical protein